MMKSFAFGLAALASISRVSAGLGIAYGAVLNDGSTCKTQDQINADFGTMLADDNYATVRIYGVNCIAEVFSAVVANNIKLFVGMGNDLTTTAADTQTIINAVNGNWGFVDTVAVGNEGLAASPQAYSQDQITSAVQQTKSTLSGAGYSGAVTTVDVFYVFINTPSYCTIGDYVAINAYAFFDTPNGQDYTNAAGFLQTQLANVQNACGGARVVITETGWPSAGNPNVNSVPSPSNQAAAIGEIKGAFSQDLYLFEAFNEYWKDPGQYGVEQHWGFLGDSAAAPAGSKRSIRRERRSPQA